MDHNTAVIKCGRSNEQHTTHKSSSRDIRRDIFLLILLTNKIDDLTGRHTPAI